MTQIEQLTAIISRARRELKGVYASADDIDRAIAERLVEKGAVLLPCKAGDTVYSIYNGRPVMAVVYQPDLDDIDYLAGMRIGGSIIPMSFGAESIGKTVFLTREEALCKIQSKREQ